MLGKSAGAMVWAACGSPDEGQVWPVVEFGAVGYRAAGGQEPGGIGSCLGAAGVAAGAQESAAFGGVVAGRAELVE